MLKQSPNRNMRTNGYKVKQGLKIFTLIAAAIWLLYQLKHSHETKVLGRKGFEFWMRNPYELMGGVKKRKSDIVMEEDNGLHNNIVDRDRVEEEEPGEIEDVVEEEDEEQNEVMEEDMMSLFEYQVEKDTQVTTERHKKETRVL
ncbi:uncharacterized protein LOC131654796 [Vicia villosa]|uniref:uncharacterized protein LOC131654796 n=1 Tax=Vicia villosa TaxID=3911 RepID=UPI00273B4B73|nr:uncharacterized protein LOC131654796 [Vicia villosa]